MKIGIYGDSYTTSHGDFYRSSNWYNELSELIAKDQHVPVNINHHGRAGSSVYYTYRKLLDTYHENDLNIVLLTGPGRFPFTVELSVPGNSQTFTCKEQVHGCIQLLNNILTEDDIKKLNNVISWFDASDDHRYFTDVSDLMTDKIESIPNTIVYPCFSDSFTPERFSKYGLDRDIHYMHSLWFRQLELLDIEVNDFTAQETENLCGHLVPEFNLFFANMVFKRIKTGKWDISGFLDVKINGPRKLYYSNYNHE